MQAILRAIEPHLKASKQARTCREYLLANQHRLDYPRFRRMGLCTSSGVVEAGCKLVVGTRLKRAGMHWTVLGANAIMALRACRLKPPLRRLLGASACGLTDLTELSCTPEPGL